MRHPAALENSRSCVSSCCWRAWARPCCGLGRREEHYCYQYSVTVLVALLLLSLLLLIIITSIKEQDQCLLYPKGRHEPYRVYRKRGSRVRASWPTRRLLFRRHATNNEQHHGSCIRLHQTVLRDHELERASTTDCLMDQAYFWDLSLKQCDKHF